MDMSVKEIVRAVTGESNAEAISFPEVVGRLAAAGIERYVVDLVVGTTTHYDAAGGFEIVPSHAEPTIAAPFSAEGVEAAVRASQAGTQGYKAFCARIAAAGCVGYVVSLVGKRAVYSGRTGESHTEWFPGARS